MRGPTSDPFPYARLLVQWQARREAAESYHRALRFLLLDGAGDASERQRALLQELNAKLAEAILAVRQASEQLQRYERGRAAAIDHPTRQLDPMPRSTARASASAVPPMGTAPIAAYATVSPYRPRR